MLRNVVLGSKRLQKFWWLLYKVAMKGLNYDRGHVPSANGEAFAAKYVLGHFKDRQTVVFDVGANRGQYLEVIQKNGAVGSKIFCFEPQQDAFIILESVAKDKPDVTTENIGLGSAVGELLLYKNTAASEYGSVYPANYTQYNVVLDQPEKIRIDTIDNYCAEHSIDQIDFLKIDVEGHELEVLKGASKMIGAGKIPFIQFEFGLAAIESRIFMKDFINLLPGYSIYRILPAGLELIKYNEYHELFLTTNYLAIQNNSSMIKAV
ncbi:MAG: FkbM family methyltransferase [Chitinophagaceae bacterium]|nr:FkbM family methyltransferase [Chitinophagaceae bacterium]